MTTPNNRQVPAAIQWGRELAKSHAQGRARVASREAEKRRSEAVRQALDDIAKVVNGNTPRPAPSTGLGEVLRAALAKKRT